MDPVICGSSLKIHLHSSGNVAQQAKPWLGSLETGIQHWCQFVPKLLHFQVTALLTDWGKKCKDGQVCGYLLPMRGRCWLLVLTWFSPGSCDHLERKPVPHSSICLLSLFLFLSICNLKKQNKKPKCSK